MSEKHRVSINDIENKINNLKVTIDTAVESIRAQTTESRPISTQPFEDAMFALIHLEGSVDKYNERIKRK